MPKHLEPNDLQEAIDSDETWIIDFWAEWCGPCKKLGPIYEEVSKEIDGVNFGKVDMEEHQQLGGKMGVRALPTLLIMKNGEEIARNSGLMSKEQLKSWIQEKA
ncbi:MAG: thioredoxin [Candidatus Nanohaloarchaea archaeon]